MNYTKEQKLLLRQIEGANNSLEDFSPDRILRYIGGIGAAIELMPTSTIKTAILAKFNPASAAYIAGISTKNVSISSGSEDVELTSAQIKLVGTKMSAIKRKVREISEEKADLIFFDLTNVDYYSHGRQSEIVRKINELEVKVTTKPAFATVLPFVQSLKTALGIFDIKETQFATIDQDKTKAGQLLQNLKSALAYTKGSLMTIHFEDLTQIFDFFPIHFLYETIVRAEDYVRVNQAFITNPILPVINIPGLKIGSTNLAYLDNMGPETLYFFTSINIVSEIPKDAVAVPGFSRLLTEILNMGPKTAKNMMLGTKGDVTKVKARITIKPRKRSK